MPLKTWLSVSFGLGIAAAIGFVLSALALQDIWHGEADLRLEFWMVRIGFSVTALFIAVALYTIGKARRAATMAG